MRDRLLERHLVAYAPIVVLRADDLVAHIGVANTLFQLLEQPQVGVCLERLTTEPASLSLLKSFPLAYAAVDPALVQAREPRTHLTTVVEAAHARDVPVIASGVDDEETLAGVRQSGVDFAAGTLIQAPSISMDFTFEPPR
jgi:EAL domain-containing protein (putative c-di-GMP-specific phosphodiesterase class I)